MYKYKAVIFNVVDGDTVDAKVDLGFKISVNLRLRLSGINTPEIRTRDKKEKEKGFIAKQFVIDSILDKEVIIETTKQGKYGRYLAVIYYGENNINLNQELNDKKLAVKYMEK